MFVETCVKCERVWPSDRFNRECSTPDWCFACRSKTIGVGFQGGKEYFHADTERNRAERAVSEAKAAGFDPVPVVSKGWNGAAPSTLRTIGKVSQQVGAFGGKPGAESSVKSVKAGK